MLVRYCGVCTTCVPRAIRCLVGGPVSPEAICLPVIVYASHPFVSVAWSTVCSGVAVEAPKGPQMGSLRMLGFL